MHLLLDKILKKRGVDDTAKLSEEEKETFDRWQKILSEGEVTLETVKNFCETQLGVIEGKFKELDRDKDKTERLVLLHSVYKSLLSIISSPRVERENLEKYLNSLL